MQIKRRRVLEDFILFPRRGNDVRMAMPNADGHNATNAVEVTLARVVPDVLHRAFDEHDGFFVVEKNSGIHELLAQREHFVGGRTGIFLRFVTCGGQRDVFHKSKRGSFLFF